MPYPIPMEKVNSGRPSYELQPPDVVVDSPSNASWRSLFAFTTRKDTLSIACSGIVTVISGIIKPTVAIFYGKIFAVLARFGAGTLSAEETLREISIWCIALTALGVAAWFSEGIFLSTWIVFGELQAKKIRQQMFIGMLDKEMEWYDLREDGIGPLLIRIQTQIRELQLALSQPLGLLLFEIFGTFSSLGIAFYFSWKLTLVILAIFPIAAIVLFLISIGLGPAIEDQKRELSRASKFANTAVIGISTVKAFNAQDHEIWQYYSTIQKVTTYYLKQARSNALQFGVTKFLLVGVFVQGFWYGAFLVNKGLDPGNVITTFYSCLSAFLAVETVLPQCLVLAKGMSAGETLRSIMVQMQRGRKVTKIRGSLKPIVDPGDIEINNLSFAYPSNTRQLVLNKANFFFPSGETTFLVGKSGSGKSTIGNLLMKYYEPVTGEILVDGKSIRTLDTDWLRRHVTLVQQDNVLFNETILQNIAFGRRDLATRDEVMKASETACLEETLEDMPKGIDTVVGSNGKALSGGQSQRVAIARARLRDSSVLILDESTSALDHRGRIEVMNAIRQWRRGKTTIIITHDLSQIQDDDYVYVMDHARVVQEGYRRKLAGKPHGIFASILREENNIVTEMRRKSKPASPTSPIPETPIEEFPERWGYISKVFGIRDAAQEPINMRMSSHRMSLGVAVAQANALRSESIWSSPNIPGSYEMTTPGKSSTPFLSTRRSSLPFPSPKPGAQQQSTTFVPKNGEQIQFESSFSDHAFRTTQKSPSFSLAIDTAEVSPGPSFASPQLPSAIYDPPNLTEKGQQVKPTSLSKVFGSIWPIIFWKERIIFVFGFFAAVVVAAATPAFAYVFSRLLNTFYMLENQTQEARKWALILLAIAITDGAASFATHYALEHSGQAWINALRVEALKRILAQPKSWFDEEGNSAGRLNDCLDRNAEEMRNLVGRFAGLIFTVFIMLGISIIWAFIISWRITLVILACGPVIYIITRSFIFVSAKWENNCNRAAQQATSIFTETFSNIRVVRALTLERYFERKHRRATVDTYRVGLRRAAYTGLLFGLTDTTTLFVIALVDYYATVLLTQGTNDLSSILQVTNILFLGVANASAIISMIPQISSSRTTATEMLHLASLPLQASHESHGTLRIATPFPIQMNKLSFTYPGQSPLTTLERIDLRIDAGICTAIVGPSGSGKSTIASILLGIYTPDEQGNRQVPPPLTFNGKSSLICNITNVRSFISVVTQTPFLFPTSIFENITYGLSESSPFRNFKSVEKAATQAGIHSFIISLEQGYDTLIGEGGMGVSGGQAQRIAIARALIRGPQVLILDEATSALDGESAEGIRRAIKVLTQAGVAVVMISHDVEMMRCADRIVVVESGRIVETGEFEELRAAGGAFTSLLGGDRLSLGLGLGLEERHITPVKTRKKQSWPRNGGV